MVGMGAEAMVFVVVVVMVGVGVEAMLFVVVVIVEWGRKQWC